MTPAEAVLLCRYVRACCPQQAIDEHTPQVWAEKLAGVRFDDARLAVSTLTDQQPFVSIAEIKTEVHRIRAKRVNDAPPYVPSNNDLTQAEQRREQMEHFQRVGDGEMVLGADRSSLPARTIPVLTKSVPA